MAKFDATLPNEMMAELESLGSNLDDITEEMLSAGAEKVKNRVRKNLSKSFKSTRSLLKGLKITKVYYTKYDGAKNIKIGFYGYDEETISLRYPKGKPIPLIALAREYGTSSGEAKKPFLRKSFQAMEIEKAMQDILEKYLPKE